MNARYRRRMLRRAGAPRAEEGAAPSPPSEAHAGSEARPAEVLASQRVRITEVMAEARADLTARLSSAHRLIDDLAAETSRVTESFQRELEENQRALLQASKDRPS